MYTSFAIHGEGLHSGHDVYFQPLLPQAYIPGDTLRMNPSFLSKASFDTEHPTASLFDSPLSGFSSDDSSFGTPPSAFSTPMLLPGSPMMLDGIESHPSTPSNVPAAATLPSDPKGRRRTRSDTTHRVEKKPRSQAIHSPARAREPSSEEEVCDPERTEEEHIKRPPNAFICFRTHFYGTVVRVEKHNANISQSAGKAWAALSAEKKAPHYAKAKFLKEEHKRKYPYWKYRPKKSKGPKKPRKSPKKYENDNVLVEAYLDGKRGEDYQKQVEEEGRLGERCLPAGAEERKRAKLEGAVKTPRPMAAKPSKPKARRVTARNEPIPSEFRFNPQISKKVTLRKEHQLGEDPVLRDHFPPEPPVSSTPNLMVDDAFTGHYHEPVDYSSFMVEQPLDADWMMSSNQFHSSLPDPFDINDISRGFQEPLAF